MVKAITVAELTMLMADPAVVTTLRRLLVDNQEVTGVEAEALIASGYIEAQGKSKWRVTAEGRVVLDDDRTTAQLKVEAKASRKRRTRKN